MPTVTIPVTAISIQNPKATTKYGAAAAIPLRSGGPTAHMLARAALTNIPTGATLQSARLRFWQRTAVSGSVEHQARMNTSTWSTSTTWQTRPYTALTALATITRTSPAANSLWDVDVTAQVQQWVSGVAVNHGWTVWPQVASGGSVHGQSASKLKPELVVTYTTGPTVPTALHPGGTVSKAKPTLTFDVAQDTMSVQVQVDPAANEVSPAFTSGEIVTPAGVVDLETTTYPGLADGATTRWRARARNPLGWSAWSGWATWSRATWKTTTITSPSPVSEDPSPVVAATYGGVATSWQALLLDSSGRVLEEGAWLPDDGTNSFGYGMTKSVTDSGTAVVRLTDNLDRVATPGDPSYNEVSLAFTVQASGAPTPLSQVVAAQDGVRPWVHLTGYRGEVPDEVVIYRDNGSGDVLVGRVAGANCFVGDSFTWVDYTAPMNTLATYRVVAVVNGQFSVAVLDSLTPRCQGIWLVDDDGDRRGDDVVLWGFDDQEQDAPEVSIEHTPLSGTGLDTQVVRRRLARYAPQGSLAGDIADALGVDADVVEARLKAWEDYDAGHKYRLVLGNLNLRVILGNILISEVPGNGEERFAAASMSWWSQS